MDSRHQIGLALHRPVLSPNGSFVAVIVPNYEIHIISLAEAYSGSRVVRRIVLPKAARSFPGRANLLIWSPRTINSANDGNTTTTSEMAFDTAWLMLSDGNRVIAFSTELKRPGMGDYGDDSPGDVEKSNILADFEIGNQYGRITVLDFVFGHRHALLLFEMNTHASIVSLTKLQRDDVLGTKFSDARSFAPSPRGQHFALLTRSKGQDQISVFSPSDKAFNNPLTFNPLTNDAQGMKWCPEGDPLIAVWESPSYGFKVSFFSALGHHMRQLDMGSPTVSDGPRVVPFEGLGVGHLEWLSRGRKSILGVTAGSRDAFVYEKPTKTSSAVLVAAYSYPDYMDGTLYPVYQESPVGDRNFSLQKPAIETPASGNVSGLESVAVNADCSMVATKDTARPKTVWIWHVASSPSQPCSVINFRESAKKILWHPSLPHMLLVMTAQNEPTVYIWYDRARVPAVGRIPLAMSSNTTNKYDGAWLLKDIGGRYLFMLTAPDAFEIGFLEGTGEGVLFESVLHGDFVADERGSSDELDEDLVTPVRSNRR